MGSLCEDDFLPPMHSYSSRIMAQLVPMAPMQCTSALLLSEEDLQDQSMGLEMTSKHMLSLSSGMGASQFIVGGSTACFKAKAALTMDGPAAVIAVWPMFPLIDPRMHFFPLLLLLKTAVRLSSSTWSPILVPVPWASTSEIELGSTPDDLKTLSSVSAWPIAEGT